MDAGSDGSPQSVGLLLLLQLILILINAYFAAAEIAVISLNEGKLRKQAEGGDAKAKTMLKMVLSPSGFLSTIQIAITLAGFLGSAFAADNFSDMLVDWLILEAGTETITKPVMFPAPFLMLWKAQYLAPRVL